MIASNTFVRRPIECRRCGTVEKILLWNTDPIPACPSCGEPRQVEADTRVRAHEVIGDEIDRTIEHALCHADGTPRRFQSRQELRAAERAAGYRILERGERFPGDERPRKRHFA